MATSAFWKGYLKLSLVTCRVALTPATTESEKVRFHTLNAKTGHRVVSRYVDSKTGRPVDDDDQIKGYPRGDDEFVLLEEDEIAAVALESARSIDIETFVPADSIGWIWYDKPHYVTPDDEVSEEAFAVVRDAMAATKTVGISRLVLYRRERAVMLKPSDKGMILWTLRYGDEVRTEGDHFGRVGTAKPSQAAVKLVSRLIEERTTPWTPEMASDPVQDKLLDIIAAKKKGRKAAPKAAERTGAPTSNVINIMDALKNSLASERKTKGR